MNRGAASPLLLGLIFVSGCTEGSTGDVFQPSPTMVVANPAEFPGNVPCVDAPGAMRSYVVTLTDVTPEDDTDRPRDPPRTTDGAVPCEQAVGFGDVEIHHLYAAEIFAFDRADLIPEEPSSPTLLDPETFEPVEPRWTTTCAAVRAEYQATRLLHDCAPFTDDGASPTEVRVALDLEGTEFECGTDDDAVERFVVRAGDEILAEAPCGETAVLEDVTPGELLVLEALALTTDETPLLGTTCTARVLPGVSVTATCGALATTGAFEVDVAEALAALEIECPALIELEVTLEELERDPVEFTGCRGSVRFADLAPGPYTVSLAGTQRGAEEPVLGTCGVVVEPGLTARAECVAD